MVVSGGSTFPADLPLLGEPDQAVLIATGAEHALAGAHAGIEYARVGDDLPRLMAACASAGRARRWARAAPR